MSKCQCSVCEDHRRWEQAINPQSEAAKDAFREMWERLSHAETDATYWRMKFEGTWDRPSLGK